MLNGGEAKRIEGAQGAGKAGRKNGKNDGNIPDGEGGSRFAWNGHV